MNEESKKILLRELNDVNKAIQFSLQRIESMQKILVIALTKNGKTKDFENYLDHLE